jgi:hypothetical protein
MSTALVWALLAATPIFTVHGEPTFIDDGFALTPAGDRLAFVRANGADKADLEVVALPSGERVGRFSIAAFSHAAERVLFLPDGGRLLVIARAPGGTGRVAQLYDVSGRVIGHRIGPATEIALATVDAAPVIATLTVRGGSYSLSYVHADGKRLGGRTLQSDRDGLLKLEGGLKPLYFTRDLLALFAQKKGEYDKKGDVRRPDRSILYDLLHGKVTTEEEIGDVVEFVRVQQLRAKHPNVGAFVEPTEDLHAIELITAAGKRLPLRTERPFAKYEPKSLAQQEGPEPGVVYASLTVDPVNPEAVRNQKAEPDVFDLYRVDANSGACTRALVGPLAKGRPLAWVAAGGRVAILHKHKGFDRGGTDLEVYDLAR